jgi:mRNA interferase RelE/StbE
LAVEVLYKASALKDLRGLGRPVARRIVDRIDTDLAEIPGKDKALTGPFKGLFSYRVGAYRVVYTMLGQAILVLRVAHRREEYRRD